MIQQDMKFLRLKKEHIGNLKEVEKKDPRGWSLPWEGLIQAGRRYIHRVSEKIAQNVPVRTSSNF